MSGDQTPVTHVISNTHWDREWLHTFQENRIKLVDCLETVMHLLETDPDYKHFHLDSQTVPLEDYCAVRPEQAERLRGHTKAGRILVGPWYTLPEMNVIEGESIVRNLLTGHRVAREWGGAMKVGYTPTSNGQVSQLPQIYAGFGIDSVIFYRGVNRDVARDEFWWDAPDGTRALSVQFPDGRGIFWAMGFLPVAYDVWGGKGETWPWKWGGDGVPMRLDDEKTFETTRPTARWREENVAEGAERMLKIMRAGTTTRHVIAPEGHDQCPPYPLVPRFIKAINALRPGERMVHDNLPRAMAELRRDVKDLQVLTGEMRSTNQSGPKGFCYIHAGILSTRLYLKQANRRCENALFRVAEPLACAASLLGAAYPKPFFDIALKMLLQNHAHDDICGCSIDKVHDDMMYRYSEIRTLCKETVRRSLISIAGRIAMPGPADGIHLALVNPLPFARREAVQVTVDVPAQMKAAGIALQDAEGRTVACEVETVQEAGVPIMQDAITRAQPMTRFTAWVDADLPGLGYSALRVLPQAKAAKPPKGIAAKKGVLENALLKAVIRPDGSIDLLHKASKQLYKGLHWFEDRGEKGNAWTIMQPAKDAKALSSLKGRAKIETILDSGLVGRVRVTVTMKLPVALTPDFEAREKRTRPVAISSVITLRAGSDRLEFETTLDNQVDSHRLRAMFPSDTGASHSYSEMPFDVVRRAIGAPKGSDKWTDPYAPEFPQVNFCCVEGKGRGLALINEGMTDYEAVDDKRRTLALTLLRTFFQGSVWSKEKWPDRGYQCIGVQSYRYAVQPYAGSWESAGLSQAGLCHNVPVRCLESGSHEGDLPPRLSFLAVDDRRLTVHAVKQAESGKGLVVRLANPTGKAIAATLTCCKAIAQARLVSLEEQPLGELKAGDSGLRLDIPAKKIVSIALELA